MSTKKNIKRFASYLSRDNNKAVLSVRSNKVIKNILFYMLIAILFVNLVFPFYWALNSSFKTESQLAMTPATFLPRDPTTNEFSLSLKNYVYVFTNGDFLLGLLNSVIVASTTTILALIFASLAAFALGKLRIPMKTAILYVILSLTMFPQISILSGLYGIMSDLKMPARPAMILVYLLFTQPFTIWVLTNFFKDLPNELLEAAKVDGATFFQIFYKILLPLTVPALITTGLLAFITAWNEYLFALTFTITDKSSQTVPVVIALFSGQTIYNYPFGQVMAAAVIVTIPLLTLVLIFQKRIVDGLTAGAVKG